MAFRYTDVVYNKVDRKGRVSVPAAYRNALAKQGLDSIAAFPALHHPAVQGCGMDWLEKIGAQYDQTDPFSEEFDDERIALFSQVRELAFDGDGRVTLPDDLIAHAGLSDQAAIVGLGKHFHIWEPAAFKEVQRAAKAKRAAKARIDGRQPDRPPAPEGGG